MEKTTKPKIIVISDAGAPVRKELQDKIKLQNVFDVIHIDANEHMESRLRETASNTILFDCPILDKYELAVMIKISQIKPEAQMIALADQITIYSYRKIGSLKRVVTMQKPLQLPLLQSLILKSAQGENIAPPRSPRFIIDEFVRVLAMKSGLLIPTRMRNYSAGGAFLEYHGISLNVGDTISMNIAKPGFDKDHMEVRAKVVWIRDGEHARSPSRGVGVQFIPPSQWNSNGGNAQGNA